MSNETEQFAADAAILDKEFDLGSDQDISTEELEAAYQASMQDFREGEVVKGTIVEVGPDRVLVDIGYKSEGVSHL